MVLFDSFAVAVIDSGNNVFCLTFSGGREFLGRRTRSAVFCWCLPSASCYLLSYLPLQIVVALSFKYAALF
jgi:hypothetical protein